MTPTTIAHPPRQVVRRGRERLQLLDRLRVEATAVVCEAFPARGLKRLGKAKFGVSRARNGCDSNAAYRLAMWAVFAVDAGYDLAGVQRILSWTQGVIDELRGSAPVDLQGLSLAEQRSDGDEDVAQLSVGDGDPESLRRWIQQLDAHIALQCACRTEARRRLAQMVAA